MSADQPPVRPALTALALPPSWRPAVRTGLRFWAISRVAFLAYGLVTLTLLPTLAGLLIVHGGKLWYLDRMVLLFEDMKTRSARYAAWEY